MKTFFRIAGLIGAATIALPITNAFAATSDTAIWNGNINKSCSIQALNEGTVVLNSKPGDQSLLDSTEQGGVPVTVKINFIGGSGTVGFANRSASVTRNGNELLGLSADHYKSWISWGGRPWVLTYQNTHNNVYNNQSRLAVSAGITTVDVDAKTNAHLTQAGAIVSGKYIVKNTLECTL